MTFGSLLLLLACEAPAPAWRPAGPRLHLVNEEPQTFPDTPVGGAAALELAFINLGRAPATAQLYSEHPELHWSDAEVPALGEAVARVAWSPGGPPLQAELIVDLVDGELTLALSGRVLPDGDGDGHDHEALGGDDCDDADPAVFPGAPDLWYDGVDADCAGDDDHDADGDGFAAPEVGDDCDDADPTVFPGAPDLWYDGVDADCDGWSDHDADGDGHDARPLGGDCDDTDARISPDAEEIWYDGTDHDCDGRSDHDADGDGFDRVPRGADCDDQDATVYPGAPDPLDDRDQDCDGLMD